MARMFSPSSRISPVGALVRVEVVHAVEGAQQRRLAAARGADEGGDLLVRDVEVDVLQRLVPAVEEVQVPDRVSLRSVGSRRRVAMVCGVTIGVRSIMATFCGEQGARDDVDAPARPA